MLTEREFDEFRVFQEERLEREFAEIQRFYLGKRAEVVDRVARGENPEAPPPGEPFMPQGGE